MSVLAAKALSFKLAYIAKMHGACSKSLLRFKVTESILLILLELLVIVKLV